MEDTIVKLINKITELSPQLWEIMLRQVYVSAWSNLIWGILFIALSVVILLFMLPYCIKKKEQDSSSMSDWEVGVVTSFVLGSCLFPIGCMLITKAIMEFANPEYYAIQFLTQQIR